MKTTSALLALAFVSAGTNGCAKAPSMRSSDAPSRASEASYTDFDDFGGDAGFSVDDDYAVESAPVAMESMDEEMAPPEPEPQRERSRVFGRRNRSEAAGAMASPSPAKKASPATPPPAVDGGDGATPVPADERPPEVDDARHIIYTAGMRVAVFNLEDAMTTAENLPERFGGYVQTLTENQIVLRLPSKSLREVMTALSGYGNVEQRWMRSQDVTAEFTDIESKLRALAKTEEQLLELLGKARTVAEALEVRRALDQVTAELEVLKGRMRQIENMTTFSTLTLQFYERGPHNPTPSSNDPFPWVDSLGVEDTEWK